MILVNSGLSIGSYLMFNISKSSLVFLSNYVNPINSNFKSSIFTESWIELGNNSSGPRTPERVTPLPFQSGEEYLRLLREAQRESNQSSRVVSLASSRRDTPHDSPKSPPNSPNTELCNEDELKGVYINYWNKVSFNGL